MIRSGLIPGLAFGFESDGDARTDAQSRRVMSAELGVASDWATVRQVHGHTVRTASHAASYGDADGLITTTSQLPLSVATADCLPVAIAGARSIALVHAGWRGLASGVIGSALQAMSDLGDTPLSAVVGPHIGSCCYEVGDEVIAGLGGHASMTKVGTQSADLASAARSQLAGVEIEVLDICTAEDSRFASFRASGTTNRQVAVAWLT